MIHYRNLNHQDYHDIVLMCKDNWEGTDYLPILFHQWIEEPGCLIGAVDEKLNRVVAMGRYRILPEGTGWLEGLRVDPAYQGKGLAREITDRLMATAKAALERGEIKKLGLCTHAGNSRSIHLMEQRGFHLVQAHTTLTKEYHALDRRIKPSDFIVRDWSPTFEEFQALAYFRERQGLVNLAFMFQEPTEDLYQALIKEGAFKEINGAKGFYKIKGEPYFIAIDDSLESIKIWMDFLLLSLREVTLFPPITTILAHRQDLFLSLRGLGYGSLGDEGADYLYYEYQA